MNSGADLGNFVALVAQMRAAQREYFSTRRQSALESAKRLERAVDEAIAAMTAQPTPWQQEYLPFGDDW